MYRAGNGSGASDAWSLSMWIRQDSTHTNAIQTIFNNHSDDVGELFTKVVILIQYKHPNKSILFRYGNIFNDLRFETPNSSITPDQWHHVLWTYAGGVTGEDAAQINNYYAEFKVYIDGSLQSTTNTNTSNGCDDGAPAKYLKIGNPIAGSTLFWFGDIDELALWDGDQSGNIANIYNSGNTHDLGQLSPAPKHYWLMESAISTLPTIQDVLGDVDLTATSVTFVNDTP